jgi:hypothetical protein
MRQLMGPTESDSVRLFKAQTKWCVFGYTRAELAALSGTAIVDAYTPRTALLAKLALLTNVPASIGAAKLVDLGTAEIDDSDNYYEFDLQYEGGAGARPPANETSPPGGPAAGGPRPSIRISTQSTTRQIANGPLRLYYRDDTVVLDSQVEGIVPDGQGGYRGANVMIPMLSWSENHVIEEENFSLQKGVDLVGKTNADEFRGFAPGAVICVGANADQRADGKWDASVEFQHSKGIDDAKAPGFDNFENVTKGGWEFLFPIVQDKEIRALCVAPLYDSTSFGDVIPSLSDTA